MKKVFIVYATDYRHTQGSRKVLGIGSDRPNAMNILFSHVNSEEGVELSDEDIHLLDTINQTQNFKGVGEFVIEEITLDVLI